MGDNILNIKEKPSPAYRGSDPYIFVSYASEDLNDVLPDIKRLQDLGYNVFYDENLVQDDVAVPEILQHIDDCTLFIVFVSDNSVASEKIKDELRYAISEKKPMLAILFNDFKEIEMSSLWTYELLNIQKINRNNLHDDDVFRSQMDDVFQTALENSKEEPEEISFYKSDEPYICVSYDDEDHMEVFAEIRRLHHLGCNILS